MATYGQLLIKSGGGVIDHGKQSARQDGATLVIGLGGTGSDAVMKLKKEVFKQLKPDDEDAVIPTYSAIKYLVVDSDASKINAQAGKLTDIDRNTEFFEISNSNIKATFGATEILKNRPELYWLDYEHISINQASAVPAVSVRLVDSCWWIKPVHCMTRSKVKCRVRFLPATMAN